MGCDIHPIVEVCDIHPIVEVRIGGQWQPLKVRWFCYGCDGQGPMNKRRGKPPCIWCDDLGYVDHPWRDRNYDVFGLLAGVRCDDWKVISNSRELPSDLATPLATPMDDSDPDGWWGGDHSRGFVTLAELRAYDWWQTAVKHGVVGLSLYAIWDHQTPPPLYSGGVGGGGIKNITSKEADAWLATNPAPTPYYDYFEPSKIYVNDCQWIETVAGRAGSFLAFVAELNSHAARLGIGGDDVRYIFGFDS